MFNSYEYVISLYQYEKKKMMVKVVVGAMLKQICFLSCGFLSE